MIKVSMLYKYTKLQRAAPQGNCIPQHLNRTYGYSDFRLWSAELCYHMFRWLSYLMTLSNEWVMEQWWNYMPQGKRSTLRKSNCPSVTFSTTNHTWGALGSKLGLCGDKPASNELPISANDRNHTRLTTVSSNVQKKQFKWDYEYYSLLVQYSAFFVETFETFGEIYCLHLQGRSNGMSLHL